MKVTAAVTHEKGKLAIETVELDPPKASEVLVRLIASGVATPTRRIEQFIPVALPAIFGHEGVGVVEEVGIGVEGLKKGDRVISPSRPAAVRPCIAGEPYTCEIMNDLFFNGTYKDGTKRFHKDGQGISSFFGQGAFASHVVVDARNAVKVDVDDENLAYLCSLGCGVQTGAGSVLNYCKPEPGSSLVVFGCGGVGMAAIMAAKIAGCSTIIGVDVVPSRLNLAMELGATHVVNGKDVDAVEEIVKITNGGANFSIECSGIRR